MVTSDGRGMDLRVAVVALLSGLAATLAPPAPTANAVIDTFLVGGVVTLLVFVGALAPWWAVALGAGAALAVAIDPPLMVLALAALVRCAVGGRHASVAARPRRRRRRCHVQRPGQGPARRVPRGVSRGRRGRRRARCSSPGSGRRSRPVRRAAWATAGVAFLLAGARLGRLRLRSGADRATTSPTGCTHAEQGVVQLESGDFDAAARSFRDASATLAAAHERVTGPLAAAAALVPVVAQHRTAVADMSGVGAAGAATVAEALDEIDLDALRPVEGRIDLDALAALHGPLARVRAALVELQRTANASRSPVARPPGHVRARRLRQQRRGAPAWPRQRAGGARDGPANARRRRAAHVPDALHHARRSRGASAGSSAATPSSASTTAHCR